MAKLGQINTGVQSFDDMLRQKVAEDIKTGQEIKENKTHTSSSGNTHGGGGKSVPASNKKSTSNQAKTTAGRSRDSSPAPKPASTNPRATKKEAEADVKAVITDFLQKKANPGQSAASMGRPSASAYRTEALKTSYKDSMSKGVTAPAKTDEEKNTRGKVIFDALSPRSVERARAGQLSASKQKNYFSDVSDYGVKEANDNAEKRVKNITEAISNSKDKAYITEQQHIRRLSNQDGEAWENYKAIQKQKEAGQNERATYLIDTYHLRGDTKKVAEYNRIYNTEGIDKANEYALMNSGYIDLSRYTGEDREAVLKADIDRYYSDGQSGILGDENFMWEFEKQNMNELDRRYYDKRDSVFNGYAQMMAKDPEAEKKISEGMGYVNGKIGDMERENMRAFASGSSGSSRENRIISGMTDEQKRLWAYVSSISKDDEKKYLDSIAYRLDKQYNQKVAEDLSKLSGSTAAFGGILASAVAQIPASTNALMNIGGQAMREKFGAEYMPSSALAEKNFSLNAINALNEEALSRMDSGALRFLYSTGSSLLQNAVGMIVFNEFYPLIMSMSAAGGTAQESLQRGMGKNSALLNGAAAGGIEYITEKLGYDRLMNTFFKPGASVSTFKGISKAFFANGFSEFGEEFTGAIAQGIADLAICGDLSQFELTKKKYMSEYRSPEWEAQELAFIDCFIKEPIMNGFSGFISGGILGGTGHVLGLAREGVSFVESNIGDAALVTALKANTSTNTRQIADKILGKLSDGKRVSALDYGNLKSAMQSENIRVDGKKAAKAMEQTSGAPEILYKKNGGGVAGTVAASRLSGIQYSFLDTLGKSRGINFVVADYLGKNTGDGYVTDAANGLTSSKDPNTIFLSANSERPILAVAKHELVHMLKGTKSGAEYIDSIGKTLKNADSEAFETAIENIIDRHAAYGEVISRKAAIEELAADSAWRSVGKYSEVARLAEENPKLLKKVYNMIVDLAGTVSGAYKDTGNFAEGLMDKMTEQELRSTKEMMGRALGETPANVDDFKFSLKDPEFSMTQDDINAIQNIGRKSVNDFASEDVQKTEKLARQYFNELGVKSPFFKAWFGDWENKRGRVSKIVDENGKPKIMYHGSPNEFTVFDISKSKYSNTFGKGFYFTDSALHAGTYRNDGKVYQVYLNIKNPVDSDTKVNIRELKRFIEAVAENEDYSIENYGTYDVNEIIPKINKDNLFTALRDISSTAIGDYVEAVKLYNEVNGTDFDGIISDTETVAFYPEQIKSATDNIGTFDGNNPDIRYSLKAPPKSLSAMSDAEIERLERDSRGIYQKSDSELTIEEKMTNGIDPVQDSDIDYLVRENNTLRNMITSLSSAIRNSKIGQMDFDSKKLIDSVKQVIKDNNSKANFKTVAARVAKSYSLIYEATTNTNISDKKRDSLYSRADLHITKAAQIIIDGMSDVYDFTEYKATKDMRNYIRKTKINIPSEFDSKNINDFIKTNFGSLRLVKTGGVDVDTFWGELCSLYPEYFNYDAAINREDMLVYIAHVLDSIKPVQKSLTAQEYEEAIMQTAIDLSMLYPETVFDFKSQTDIMSEIERELNKKYRNIYGEKYKEAKNNLNKRYSEKYKNDKDKNKSKIEMISDHYKEMLAAEREANKASRIRIEEKYKEKLARFDERQKNAKDRIQTIDKLQKALNSVRKLKTTDPEARNKLNAVLAEVAYLYSGAKGKPRVMSEEALKNIFGDNYSELLEGLSEDELLEYKFHEIEGRNHFISIDAISRYYYENAANDPNHITNNFLEKKFEAAHKTGLNELTTDNAKEILQMLIAVETDIKNANKLIDSQIKANAAVVTNETLSQIRKAKGSKGEGRISNFLSRHLTSVSAAKKFVGYAPNSKFVKLFEEIRDGERKKDAIVQKSTAIFDDFLNDEDNVKFMNTFDDVVDIGNGIKITKGMRLSLCLYARNKQSAEHIHGGGITIPNIDLLAKGNKEMAYKRGETVQITQEMQKNILNSLTEQEKLFIEYVDKTMDYISKQINEMSLALYGYEIANVSNYFPILTDKSFIGKEVMDFEEFTGSLESAGFLKERRPSSYTPIIIDDCVDILMNHIHSAAKVSALAAPMRNLKMVYGAAIYKPTFNIENGTKATSYISVQKALENKWGTEAVNYINNFIDDIEGRSRIKDNGFFAKLYSNLAKSALLVNLSVVMKQVSAYFITASELGHGTIAEGLLQRVSKKDKEFYDSITPVIWKRRQGFNTNSISDYAGRRTWEEKNPELFGWIQASDIATSYKICKACELYVVKKYGVKRGSDNYNKLLADTINTTMERTQQSNNVSLKSDILRSGNPLVASFNMFKTQTYLQFDMLYDSINEFNAYKEFAKKGEVTKDEVKEKARKCSDTITAFIVSEICQALITIFWKFARGKDEKFKEEDGEYSAKKIIEFGSKVMIQDTMGMLMFGNELSDALFAIFSDERYYGIDVSAIQMITDGISAIVDTTKKVKNIFDLAAKGDYYSIVDSVKPVADNIVEVLAAFGLPVRNAINIVGAISNVGGKIIEHSPFAEKADEFMNAIEGYYKSASKRIKADKTEASKAYKLKNSYENAETYKRLIRAAGAVANFKEYMSENPQRKKEIEHMMDACVNYFREFKLPDDVASEAERLYTQLQKQGYGDIAAKAIPYSTFPREIAFKYGGEKFNHLLDFNQYNDYIKRINSANIEAYKELLGDETYKSQDVYTQAKMLDKLRTEKVNQVEINMFDEIVGFTDEQRRAEDKKQFSKAKNFVGLPGKKYIKLEDFQFEVTEETYKKYDDYLKAYDSKVKELMNSGVALNSINGFEKVYFKDDNGQKVYIDRPYNDYNETFKSKIDTKIKEIAKGTIENPQTEEQAQITKDIIYSTGTVYTKNPDVMANINQGDYSRKLWQRNTVDNLRNNIKEQQAAVQSAEQQVQTGRQNVVNMAKQYIGVPYKWGGTSPNGFDCSGFVQYVYKQYGISLPRTTAQQPDVGTAVDKSELQPGDLVFFRGSQPHSNGIGHVGIYIGNDQFIHAPSTGDVVKISKLSSRKDYRGARRIIND